MNKKILIPDSLHGVIPVTHFEYMAISSEVFSRLHNTLQNSTAYLTYPAVRTSRFSHSLGCLHLASALFRAAWGSADGETQKEFLSLLGDAFEPFHDLNDDLPLGDVAKTLGLNQALRNPHEDEDESILRLLAPGVQVAAKDLTHVYIAYQGLRLAALLHDLGHPPFSHVVERSLYRLALAAQAEPSANSEEPHFVRIMKRYVEQGTELHEPIGEALAELLLGKAINKYSDVRKARGEAAASPQVVFVLWASRVALMILRKSGRAEKHQAWRLLHTLISGDIDADRLDYVVRDSIAAGRDVTSFSYSRLINSFRLVGRRSPRRRGSPALRFLPTVQAISSIEDLLERRFNLYRYVIHHHRVVKTDALLLEIIETLGRSRLQDLAYEAKDSDRLELDVALLWRVLDVRRNTLESAQQRLIQWDEAWLMTVLRKHYFELQERRADPPSDDDEVTRWQLEELLSNRKYYHSLFKRSDELGPVDVACRKRFRQLAKGAGLTAKPPVELHLVQLQAWESMMTRLLGTNHGGGAPTFQQGLFINRLLTLCQSLGASSTELAPLLDRAVALLRGSRDLKDVLCVPKPLKVGVSRDFTLLDSDGAEVLLSAVSGVRGELEMRASQFPPFFVYLLEERPTDELRSQFGAALARAAFEGILEAFTTPPTMKGAHVDQGARKPGGGGGFRKGNPPRRIVPKAAV